MAFEMEGKLTFLVESTRATGSPYRAGFGTGPA